MDDLDDLVYICNNVDRSYLSDRMPSPYQRKDAGWWISMVEDNDGKSGVWRMIWTDGHPIGVISVEKDTDVYRMDSEIGYYLLDEYKSKGIMTEAVRQICQIAFDSLDILRITGRYIPENVPSGRVLVKAGFQPEGMKRQAVIKENKVYDLHIVGLLKEEYLKEQ